MKSSVLIHGSYYTRNFGDLLLAEIISKRLQSHTLQTICPWLMEETYNQVSFNPGYGLTSFLFRRPLIFGGGGYISNNGGRKRALRWLLPALLSNITRKPYVIVAPGTDDVLSETVRNYYVYLFEMADEVTVRDIESYNALRSAGVKRDMSVTIDTAVSVSMSDIPEKNQREAENIIPKSGGAICLNAPQMGKAPLFKLVALVKKKTQKSRLQRIWLFENEPYNINYLKEALDYHELNQDIVLFYKDMWTVAAILGRCRAVLTTQLHVGIVSYALGVAPCSLSAHHKTKRFFRQINRTQWQQDFLVESSNGSTVPVVIDSWLQAIVDNEKSFYELDKMLMTENKEKAQKNLQVIDSYVAKHA